MYDTIEYTRAIKYILASFGRDWDKKYTNTFGLQNSLYEMKCEKVEIFDFELFFKFCAIMMT